MDGEIQNGFDPVSSTHAAPPASPDTAAQPAAKSGMSIFYSDNPVLQEMLKPAQREGCWVNEPKIRRLYLQAASQQWFAPTKIDYTTPSTLDEQSRLTWQRLMTIFYTLEKMGLNVIMNMMPKAAVRLKSEEAANYLSVQCYDESRHVFAIENYLRKLGAPPKYDWQLHVLGQAASLGFYRVENWLFSTLFSENFASVFLRHTQKKSNIDQTGNEMCKILQIDESRHLHFLHIVLPDIMDRLSLMGRGYVKLSQSFIMRFTERVSRSLDNDARLVGLDRRALLEEVFENVEKAYEGFGVTRNFLTFPKITDAPGVYVN